MKKILLLIIVSTSIIFSQNLHYTTLFNDFIPDGMQNNRQGLEQVELNLKQNALIHPALIYYYLKYLDLRINHNILKPQENFFEALSNQSNVDKKIKNDFAVVQKRKIEEKNYPYVKENAMVSCLDDFFIDYNKEIHLDPNIKIDRNKQNYFVYISLSDKSEPYDSLNDYAVILDREIDKKFDHFNSLYQNLKKMSRDEKFAFVEEMNTFWYFFDPAEKFFTRKLKFEPNELAQDIYKDDYYILGNFMVEFFYYPLNYIFNTTGSKDISTSYCSVTTPDFERKLNTKIEYTTNKLIDLFAGYRVVIKREYGAFSYLDAELGFALNNIEFDAPFGKVFYSRNAARVGAYIDTKAYLEKKNSFSYSASARALVPLLYFTRALHIKLGVGYEMSFIKFDYSIKIPETITDLQGNQEFNNYDQEGSYSKTNNYLTGIVSLNATFSKFINFSIEGDISNYFGAGIGASILF